MNKRNYKRKKTLKIDDSAVYFKATRVFYKNSKIDKNIIVFRSWKNVMEKRKILKTKKSWSKENMQMKNEKEKARHCSSWGY